MEKIDILMWAIGGGFAGTWGLFWIMFSKFDRRLEKIEDKINNIDKRLVAVETLLHMKECCMLKDDRIKQKAE